MPWRSPDVGLNNNPVNPDMEHQDKGQDLWVPPMLRVNLSLEMPALQDLELNRVNNHHKLVNSHLNTNNLA